jgi:hypothetical protein
MIKSRVFVGFVLAVVLGVSVVLFKAVGLVGSVTSNQDIVQNYQWFYDQYNAVQSQKINYESMPDGAQERDGMRMVLNNSISEYNSRSRQITRNLWKANDLPYQIELVGGTK